MAATTITAEAYERHRERARRRQAELSRAGREIAPLPPIRHPERRIACARDLALGLQTYFPETFFAPWSDDHRLVLGDLQRVLLHGGRSADAVYRGFGKTSLTVRTLLLGALYGHRLLLPIVGADQGAAERHLGAIKTELEQNERLLEDFPEVCYPIRCLEGVPQRRLLYRGRPVHMVWRGETLVLPILPGSPAADVAITAAGLTSSRIRGLYHTRQDGRTIRAEFYLVDDPQTDESAASPTQVQRRLSILTKGILRTSSHRGSPMAVVVAGTVIEQDDLLDTLTDHERSPAWQNRRIPLVRKMPKALDDLWLGRYAELRRSFDPSIEGDRERAHTAATAFYEQHRKAMDAGAEVSWEGCYEEGEISALQHALNILIDDGPAAFGAECQQRPELADAGEEPQLTAGIVLSRLNGRDAGTVGAERHVLTAHIDIHDKLLTYAVVAMGAGFAAGEVIDYGEYPEQRRRYWSLHDARISLRHKAPGAGVDGAMQRGLEALATELLARRYRRDDGGEVPIDAIGIDIGYKPDIVQAVCRKLRDPRLMPVRGVGIKAVNRPIAEYKRKPGERLGDHWLVPSVRGTRQLRHVRIDTNHWKRVLQLAFLAEPGDQGSITLWGKDARRHRLLADHVAKAEYATKVSAAGRTVYEYQIRPAKPDNHYFDNLVACLALASFRGIRRPVERGRRRRARGPRLRGVRYLRDAR